MIANANFCPNPAYSPAFFLRRIGIVKTLRPIFKTWFDVAGAPRSTMLSRSRISSRFVMSAAFLLPRNGKESWRRAPRQFATTLNTSCIFPACCDTMLLFWTQRFRTGESGIVTGRPSACTVQGDDLSAGTELVVGFTAVAGCCDAKSRSPG